MSTTREANRRFPMTILFLHGWKSVAGGVKPTYLQSHGHEVINPALPDDDFAQAVRIAQAEFDKHQPQVVVGSSRGKPAERRLTWSASSVSRARSASAMSSTYCLCSLRMACARE